MPMRLGQQFPASVQGIVYGRHHARSITTELATESFKTHAALLELLLEGVGGGFVCPLETHFLARLEQHEIFGVL